MKKIFLLSCFLVLKASSALAHQTCTVPPFYDGFSYFFTQATNIVSGFIYGIDETFLYVILKNGFTNGYILVPQTTATKFQISSNPDTFYSTQINSPISPSPPLYHETLMTESCGNLLAENSKYLLTR